MKGQSFRELKGVLLPKPLHTKLEELHARALKEKPEDTTPSFVEFFVALALTGAPVVEQALEQEARKTSLIARPGDPVPQETKERLRKIREQIQKAG